MPPKKSPPKHRHDGTSPLPLGMDWSPPPKKWMGRNTVWPHDPHTGWSYCVTVPSWVFRPEPGHTEDNMTNPIVFYRVQVGIQSPEGVTTSCVILRRFSDFLKLFSELKRAFPRKNIPQPPPKHAFLRINSSHLLLEERRYALEEWTGKLLSDIDLSRSVQVASFLDLESAVRATLVNTSQNGLDSNISDNQTVRFSLRAQASNNPSIAGGSLTASATQSVASDCGSDGAYESSDTEIIGRVYNNSQTSTKLVQEFSSSISSSVKYGLSIGEGCSIPPESLSDQLEGSSGGNKNNRKYMSSEDDLKDMSFLPGDGIDFSPIAESEKRGFHLRKLSSESVASDISSVRGSELSIPGMSPGNTFIDVSEGEAPGTADVCNSTEMPYLNDAQIVLPLDQRHKLNRILITMQRRLVTAKTDMEDLIARLNQEIAVKAFLMTKVKDMEVELESTKERNKENLHQAVMSERQKVTQMQWEMDELRRKSQELESKFVFEQNERMNADSQKTSAFVEKETLMQELTDKGEELRTLHKRLEYLEHKSKSDIKVLSKEVKTLRNSQAEIKEKLNQSLKENSELEERSLLFSSYTGFQETRSILDECEMRHLFLWNVGPGKVGPLWKILQAERQNWRRMKLSRRKLLHECALLRRRLWECNIDFLSEDQIKDDSFSPSDALETLGTSDSRIGLLLAEAQLLADEDVSNADVNKYEDELLNNSASANGDDLHSPDDEVRKMLTDILIDNASLRKQINSITRVALKTITKSVGEDEQDIPKKSIFGKIFDR